LPTRNGGPFLGEALDSILDQTGDFEVVIGDNANTDETAAVLSARVGDARLRVLRSESVLTVTENWMRCLEAARGDHFLMIGDDDCLLPRFFDEADRILRAHDYPDCLTFNGYSYVAPRSIDESAPALWAPRHFNLLPLRPERELRSPERIELVQDMFRFRVRFPLNMQLTMFSRSAVAAVPGAFFRAPFPDHFALNSLLLRARRFVVTDARLVVVGVSPKSFGHYFYGGQQARGLQYLGSSSTFPGRLEGSELVNSMYSWLLELRRTYPELASVKPSRWHYAARQVNHWYRQLEFGRLSLGGLLARARHLRPCEFVTVLIPVLTYRLYRRLRSWRSHRPFTYISDSWPALRETRHGTIGEFAASLQAS
jgi:glycosyltransferase involved in cell wall biosynthesis